MESRNVSSKEGKPSAADLGCGSRLYMAAFTARRFNPVIRAFAARDKHSDGAVHRFDGRGPRPGPAHSRADAQARPPSSTHANPRAAADHEADSLASGRDSTITVRHPRKQPPRNLR